MTLVIVLMWGLGAVLAISSVERDPKTGKLGVSVAQTIQDVWNDNLDFAKPASTSTQSGVYVPASPSTTTLATSSYQNAAVASYLQTQKV